jgi:hypothetical protein
VEMRENERKQIKRKAEQGEKFRKTAESVTERNAEIY